MEPEAKESFCDMMKKIHRGFQAQECGLFVYKEEPFLGASPDLLVNCDCCGEGLLEIRCPFSCAHLPPAVGTSAYLVWDLAVTDRQWCDLVVYTKHGLVVQRYTLDRAHWQQIRASLNAFFKDFMLPHLLSLVLEDWDFSA